MSKPKNTCLHDEIIKIKLKNNQTDKINFCRECQGIYLNAKNEVSTKTISYFNQKENSEFINPIFLYQKIRINDKNFSLKFENSYCSERKNVINFITKLANKYKVSEESFYLSILFLDYIVSETLNKNLQFDLLAIASFFLAGNFNYFIISTLRTYFLINLINFGCK